MIKIDLGLTRKSTEILEEILQQYTKGFSPLRYQAFQLRLKALYFQGKSEGIKLSAKIIGKNSVSK